MTAQTVVDRTLAVAPAARTGRRLAFSRSWATACRASDWSPRAARSPYYLDRVAAPGLLARDWAAYPRDAAGVVRELDGRYDPLRVAHLALLDHARYVRSGDALARASFLALAAWLGEAVRDRADGALPMPRPNARYAAPAGHLSAPAQGLAISALLRAHGLEPNAGFVDAARRAAGPFLSSIDEGGVVWRSASGDAFFEEAAVLPSAHALGGFLLAFVGLFELQQRRPVEPLGRVVGASIATLQRRLAYYDAGFWSFEDARVRASGDRFLAPLRIHDANAALLRVCASMTGDRYFEETARVWRARVDDVRARRRLRAASVAPATGVPLASDWSWTAF